MGKKYFLPLGGIFVVALLVYVFAFRSTQEGTGMAGAPGPRGGRPGSGPAAVTVSKVEQGAFSRRTEFVGTLRAISQAELYAKASGPVMQVFVEIGDQVRKGQLLAQIDDAEAREGVRQSEAALKMAQATVAQRESALHVARMNAERSTALREKALISQQDYDAAQADLLSAQAQLKLAEAQVDQANANLSRARLLLENTQVLAPFDGFIGKRFLDQGAFAATNRPVFSIVDLSTIKTSIALVDKDAVRIRAGQTARVVSDALPGKVFEARIARISPVYDPQTGTTEAEIEIPNPDGLLRPGMLVRVQVAYHSEPSALLVPRAAVVESDRGTFVFVAEPGEADNWTARQISVNVIGEGDGSSQGYSAVEGSLKPGDQVVTLGQETLRDGTPLRLTGEVANPDPAARIQPTSTP